jgi:NitT/TauT family transport system ATP-binding protein
MTIVLENVGKIYETRQGAEVVALQDISTRIEDGEFVTLVGPSGCGKSTLLSILAELDDTTSGTVEGLAHARGNARNPGVIFQHALLLPWRTVLQNVMLPSQVGGRGVRKSREDTARWRATALELIDMVGLSGFENRYPRELSGGMQQRAAIARGMLMSSTLMLFDEPFSALDEFTREQMHLTLQQVWMKKPFTAVFVTHNIHEAIFLSDRVYVMTPRPGRVAAEVPIDLPRPRTHDLLGSNEFARHVALIRDTMDEHWDRQGGQS